MLASKTTIPVLGVPVPSKHLAGQDSLYSIVQMPKGIPVATFAIGEAGAANAALFAGTLQAGQTVTHHFGPGRVGYLVAATGSVTVNGIAAGTRDGVTIADEGEVTIVAGVETELVLVDLRA